MSERKQNIADMITLCNAMINFYSKSNHWLAAINKAIWEKKLEEWQLYEKL